MSVVDKPRIAVHKFASCDGCQLAFLNLGPELIGLSELVDIVHFAEAGPVQADAQVDIAFIEGSVCAPEDGQRLQDIRMRSRYIVTIGACATAGGLQALRNLHRDQDWLGAIYATPATIASLDSSTPIAAHIKVDLELWGCPINAGQLLAAVRALLFGVAPVIDSDKVCMECKRQQSVCVLVTRGEPCMGPVTRSGCGALCPHFGRECYACYGPAENSNTASLSHRFEGLGLTPAAIARRYRFINNAAPTFDTAAQEIDSDNGQDT